jgi:hypothetical protein
MLFYYQYTNTSGNRHIGNIKIALKKVKSLPPQNGNLANFRAKGK